MAERVGVVGSRRHPPLDKEEEFLTWLHGAHPNSIVVSGGADGADKFAERFWLEHGGRVESYRVGRDPRYPSGDVYIARKWILGPGESRIEDIPRPHFDTYESVLWYRNMLIAEVSDRVVAFMRDQFSKGSRSTIDFAKAEGKETYEVYS